MHNIDKSDYEELNRRFYALKTDDQNKRVTSKQECPKCGKLSNLRILECNDLICDDCLKK